jgi:anti-sigma factor RsiW
MTAMEECKEECKHASWLSGFLDKELTQEEQCQLRQHLQECPQCRKLLGELETMEHCLCTLSAPCPAAWEALWETVAREVTPEAKASRRWSTGLEYVFQPVTRRLLAVRRWWLAEMRARWAVAVAATVLALVVGLWALGTILSGWNTYSSPVVGAPGAGPSARGAGPVALAPADALDVEIDQSQGEPGALLLVSADGKTAVVWVMSDQPGQAAPDI